MGALAIAGNSGNSGIVQRVGAGVALDPDAASYIAAVEAADGQALEPALAAAYNEFVVGSKADASPFPGVSNFDAIKASCIMAGARTLAGALVPLRGPAPTNFNFVAGDYSRITGLKGNSTNKLLLTGRPGTADPQDRKHLAVYRTEAPTTGIVTTDIGSVPGAGSSCLLFTGASRFSRINSNSTNIGTTLNPTGFWGASRSNSSQVASRIGGISTTEIQVSETPNSSPISVFARGGNQMSDARLSYYSIGEAVDLAALDARLTTLMSAISAALV